MAPSGSRRNGRSKRDGGVAAEAEECSRRIGKVQNGRQDLSSRLIKYRAYLPPSIPSHLVGTEDEADNYRGRHGTSSVQRVPRVPVHGSVSDGSE
ncbi:hypothetical protein BaRGS_00013294 [Batillaria attramentaria]|uniref:Uncharacterized protein n=1 Tax=Batillaria attramentaria TaxID=370345 RepID=A0ABD0L867_9CAEN